MNSRKYIWHLTMAMLLASACGGGNDDETVQPLDPEGRHYGGTYSDWAAEWWRWVYEMEPTDDCGEPAGDATGELCDLGQKNSESEVFFLVGTYGGKVKRSKCEVPRDKALFFPLVTSSADNAGETEDSEQSDDQLRGRIDGEFDVMPQKELFLSIDGLEIGDLGRFSVKRARYEYTLPEPPNLYDCFGAPGVTGTYEGFTSGYFILLPPLSAGEHELQFGGVIGEGDDTFLTHSVYDPLEIK
jgi:hypothetical protein